MTGEPTLPGEDREKVSVMQSPIAPPEDVSSLIIYSHHPFQVFTHGQGGEGGNSLPL